MDTPKTVEAPRRRSFAFLFRWKTWRVLLLFLACLATLLGLFHAEEDWRGKRAWETYKESQEAAGVHFDIARLIPPTVPDAENFAMTPFLAPLFDFVPGTQQRRDTNGYARIYAALNLPEALQGELRSGNWPKGKRVDLVKMANEWAASERQSNIFQAGQSAEAAGNILERLQPKAAIFEELRQAAGRPHSRFNIAYDYQPEFGILLPHIGFLQQAVRALELRACAELELGRTDAAAQDVALMFRLGESVRDEPIIVSQMFRGSALTAALQPVWEGLGRKQWSDAQLKGFTRALEGAQLLEGLARAMDGERRFGESLFAGLLTARNPIYYVDDMTTGSPPGPTFGSELVGRSIGLLCPRGWIYLEELNYQQLYGEQIANVTAPNGIDPEDVQQRADNVLGKMGADGFLITVLHHRTIARIFLPAVSGSIWRAARAQDNGRLGLIACALERYRLANGQLPQSLEGLTPRFLAAMPRDVVMDLAFIYERGGGDDFTLYSLGWNMKDDHGVPSKESVDDGDWVWRVAAGR